ncbi:hypothetical protein D3C80_1345090 [compost metagenome]
MPLAREGGQASVTDIVADGFGFGARADRVKFCGEYQCGGLNTLQIACQVVLLHALAPADLVVRP